MGLSETTELLVMFWNCTGNVAVGNLSKMLPFVLHEIEKQPKRQYLLLHSLKEASSVLQMFLQHIFVMAVVHFNNYWSLK